MATSNINFTITKPSLGYDITNNVLAPSEIVTKRDVNKLNTALKNNINYLMIYPEDNWLDIISIIKEKFINDDL